MARRLTNAGVREVGDQSLVSPAPLARIAAELRSGRLGVADYFEQILARIGQVDPLIRALLPEPDRPDRLRREAAALMERLPNPATRPSLYGIAVGVKDLFRVDGFPTQAGSDVPPDAFIGPQASIVTTLRAAGAVILAKTAMDELAYCEPARTRNPHNLAHTPGGSSSGSAAAVAAALCPLAIGTQTSRSVIGPAAFCGIVGFKPTLGRIPIDGVVHLAPSFDTIGLFTQDTAGMLLAAGALVPEWQPAERRSLPILGVPDGKLLTWTLEEGRRAFEIHVGRLLQSGYEVRRVHFLDDDEVMEMDHRAMALLHGEMARVHAAWFAEYAECYRPRTARAIRRGQRVTDADLASSQMHQRAFRARVEALMKEAGIDLWITPASAGPAPAGLQLTGWGEMTTAWSYAGLPCITLPASRAANGLPLGLQCVAATGRDEHLLAWASEIEAVFNAGHAG